MAQAEDGREAVVEAKLSPEFVRLYLERFPVIDNADDTIPPYTEARR